MKKYVLIILSLFFTSCSYTSALSYFDFSKNKIGEYQNINVKLLWSADIGEGRSFKTGTLQPIFFNKRRDSKNKSRNSNHIFSNLNSSSLAFCINVVQCAAL